MPKRDFGGVEEDVITRQEFTLDKARDVLSGRTIAILGYGVQGPSQSQNLRDNGFDVVVGQREGTESYARAVADGWSPGETLLNIADAAQRADVVCFLLSDAGQIETWPAVRDALEPGNTLYFSHGFGITFRASTGITPPADVDVVLVAPKGSGTSARQLFLHGKGINSSIAVHQDVSGHAWTTVKAMGIGIGSGYLFTTTFENEVHSDLTGERGALAGAIAGLFEAQYYTLRGHGHSPSEAFNETVEELTQSLMPLVGERGLDWMLANISTTAQRGALDWKGRFREALEPVFEELYDSVTSGVEAKRTIEKNSDPNYRKDLEAELAELRESELWRAGAAVRRLRPSS